MSVFTCDTKISHSSGLLTRNPECNVLRVSTLYFSDGRRPVRTLKDHKKVRRPLVFAIALLLLGFVSERRLVPTVMAEATTGHGVALFNDAHFHLLNYAQRGISARSYLDMVGNRVGRTAMFGIPLQQKWDYFVSGSVPRTTICAPAPHSTTTPSLMPWLPMNICR